MKLFVLCIIIGALSVKCNNNTINKEYLDLNDGEDQAFLWKNLFTKLNTVLSETENISRNLLDVNKRLNEISQRQEDQETRLTELMEIKGKTPEVSKTKKLAKSWTTILRRQDGSVSFERNWHAYKNGFGNLESDFFIGLETLHKLTTMGPSQELLITLTDFDDVTKHASYESFAIGNESELYAITELGTYSGDAGDGLDHHRGQPFSTFDSDNSRGNIRDCPRLFKGGWWYYDPCYIGHLNGPYRSAENSNTWGVSWDPWRKWNYSVKYAAMMIRTKT